MIKVGFGIFCTNSDGSLSTNHTFKLRNLSFQRVIDSFNSNLNDLFKLLELCKDEKIEVFRLGSNFIPFASHKYFKKSWLKYIEPHIVEAGKRIRNYNVRITMHPGQFTVLNSLNHSIVDKSLKELEYHFWLLDNLGIDNDGIVIVHIGGIYKDKKKAMERFISTVEKNSWLKRRLAVENDEKFFNANDVLYIAKTLNIPFVFDYFHHNINPCDFDPIQISQSWYGKGIPKFHLSSQGKGKIGVHGDYVLIEDFIGLMKIIKLSEIRRVHIMIEAKKKELAIKRLKQSIFDILKDHEVYFEL